MGKASRKKKERRSTNTEAGVSSRGSFQGQSGVAAEKTFSCACSNTGVMSPLLSETSKPRSANWGGRRTNQTGRPKLYDSDEERLAAAAARRRAMRSGVNNPPPKRRGRPPTEEPKSTWGGVRSGSGRPLIYKTREERLARNNELSKQNSARWRARKDVVRLIENSPQDWRRFSIRTNDVNPPPKSK
jgi:hypothetical protein